MVIFNSYVKLPEGTTFDQQLETQPNESTYHCQFDHAARFFHCLFCWTCAEGGDSTGQRFTRLVTAVTTPCPAKEMMGTE